MCSRSREFYLQLQLKLPADTGGVLTFSPLLSGGVSVMSIYINKLVPSDFQTPDNFSSKFSSLKIRILYVLYMYFCFYLILENLTSFVKFTTH